MLHKVFRQLNKYLILAFLSQETPLRCFPLLRNANNGTFGLVLSPLFLRGKLFFLGTASSDKNAIYSMYYSI